jgi:hypothetical protein
MSQRLTVYIANDERHEGWEDDPQDCRCRLESGPITDADRHVAATTHLVNVPGGQTYIRVANGADEQAEIDDYLAERGKWNRNRTPNERRPSGLRGAEDAPATDEPGMVAASAELLSGHGEVGIR